MSLASTFSVKEFAFQWAGTKRVYRNGSLDVFTVDDKEIFKLASGKYGQSVQGIWLEFELSTPYGELVSPASLVGNTLNDALNALNDPTETVLFYPIHDVDPAIVYEVIRPPQKLNHLSTRRTIFSPNFAVSLLATNRINTGDVPAWLSLTKLNN